MDMATRPTRTGQAHRATGHADPATGQAYPATGHAEPAQLSGSATPASRPTAGLWVAAAAQLTEAVGLLVAAAFAAASTANGRSYQLASGIALILIAVGTAAGLAVIAVGLARARPWSRTPAAMTQLFVIIAALTLLDGHRPEWGVPALVLAGVCLAGLLTPSSLRALNRPTVKNQPRP
jgi:hypothetical protein